MGMEDTLRRFGEQFAWEPAVENGEDLRPRKHYVVCGMGGSHLGAWLIKRYGGKSNVFIHRGYGLPDLPQDMWADSLVILSSYSGTTEEVLDAGRTALGRGLPTAAVSTGGELIAFARERGLPHVVIPETGLEPRMAIGFSGIAIARLMQDLPLERLIREGGARANPMAGQEEGTRLAEALQGKIPLVYSSAENAPLAFIWKIKFNETAKIQAFMNVFPEMCHNELCGFDIVDSTRPLSERFHALLLEDFSDHPRVRVRMRVAAEILGERGVPAEHIALAGKTAFEKAFNAALLADWITLSLARHYGVPNPETPLIADFKKRILE